MSGALSGSTKSDRKKEQRRRWQADYRRRYDAGRMSVTVEIDAAVIEMLIRTRWLLAAESSDRRKIAAALAAMVADAAK